MSAPQWKPGDVAMVDGCVGIFWDDCQFVYTDANGFPCSTYELKDARPLVVIDPEDHEQVKRLRDAIGLTLSPFEKTQAALRSLVAPPKPPHCLASLAIGREVLHCERDAHDDTKDHRNDSVGQGVRWRA